MPKPHSYDSLNEAFLLLCEVEQAIDSQISDAPLSGAVYSRLQLTGEQIRALFRATGIVERAPAREETNG